MEKREYAEFCRYMGKEAALGKRAFLGELVDFFRGGADLTTQGFMALMSLSALLGAGGGFLASKLTSPTRQDLKLKQDQSLASQMERNLYRQQRSLDIARQDEAVKAPAKQPRPVRI